MELFLTHFQRNESTDDVKTVTKGCRRHSFIERICQCSTESNNLIIVQKHFIMVCSHISNSLFKIMTLHYERCGKYYGTGSSQGVASEEEKRLTMILFTSIFDSLGKRVCIIMQMITL